MKHVYAGLGGNIADAVRSITQGLNYLDIAIHQRIQHLAVLSLFPCQCDSKISLCQFCLLF